MRIVTWNLGGGPYRKRQNDAWRYVFAELDPDVVLVQEARFGVPAFVTERGPFLHVLAFENADWGSGISTSRPSLNRFVIQEPGCYLCGAEIETPAGTLTLISAHVSPSGDQLRRLRTFVETLDRSLAGRSFVIAGDFNAARHWDKVYARNDYTWFFDEMAERGFHDCHWAQHGKEIQSFWGKKSVEPYQDDHVFVSQDLVPRVEGCVVVDNDQVRQLSDHGPVRLDLRL